MKAIRKMLMGIAMILFGIAIVIWGTGGAGESKLIYIGCLISFIGLILSFAGYYFTQDDAP